MRLEVLHHWVPMAFAIPRRAAPPRGGWSGTNTLRRRRSSRRLRRRWAAGPGTAYWARAPPLPAGRVRPGGQSPLRRDHSRLKLLPSSALTRLA